MTKIIPFCSLLPCLTRRAAFLFMPYQCFPSIVFSFSPLALPPPPLHHPFDDVKTEALLLFPCGIGLDLFRIWIISFISVLCLEECLDLIRLTVL